jgi:hypothetical protein
MVKCAIIAGQQQELIEPVRIRAVSHHSSWPDRHVFASARVAERSTHRTSAQAICVGQDLELRALSACQVLADTTAGQ